MQLLESRVRTPSVGFYFRHTYMARSVADLLSSQEKMEKLGLEYFPGMMASLKWQERLPIRFSEIGYNLLGKNGKNGPFYDYNVMVALDRVTLSQLKVPDPDKLKVADRTGSIEVQFPNSSLRRALGAIGLSIDPEEVLQRTGSRRAVLLNVTYSPDPPKYNLVQVFDERGGRAVRSQSTGRR